MADSKEQDCTFFDPDDTSWLPKVDMEFKTDEDAYKFYNNYARIIGFSVRKAWINRRVSGTLVSRTYVCHKEGYQGNRRDESEVKKPRAFERTGCLAHLTIKLSDNGNYRISEFHPMHNHDLVPPTKAHTLRSHRAPKRPRAVFTKVASEKAKLEYLVKQAGGYRQVNFVSVEDAANTNWAPKVGLDFESEEKAYQFYYEYAKKIGFDIRKAWISRKASGVIVSRTYVCYKEGFYGNKKDENEEQQHRLRKSERTGCHARMTIKLSKNGRYSVTEFQPIHNHEFVTARTAHTLKSHRAAYRTQIVDKVAANDMSMRSGILHENSSRLPPKNRDERIFPAKNENYKSVKRKATLNLGDIGAVLQYMQERQVDDSSFNYSIQLDKDDQIANIFWTDGISVADYNFFGDAVCFDTTYRSENYGRPLAIFYGVNNHKQTVVFGTSLIYSEAEDSFKWLFETFKKAMYGKQPLVILSDQSAEIHNAAAAVWPGTVHRICVWHIYHSAAKSLGQVFEGSKTFGSDFGKCVYDCEEEEEFMAEWDKMVEKYDLKDNILLNKLFDERKSWSVAYQREIFCADMKSTQRIESLNNMLKDQLSPERGLLQFLLLYQKVIDDRREAQINADFHATESNSILASSRMLRQASTLYTAAVFNLFQKELEMSMDCMVYNSGRVENIYEYRVMSEGSPREHLIRFDTSDSSIFCSCKKFEFVGIQCRHVLKVLDIINIKELPPRYILKRWRKDARVGPLEDQSVPTCEDDPTTAKVKRFSALCRMYNILSTRAAETVEGYTLIESQLDQLLHNVNKISHVRHLKEPRRGLL